MVPDFNKEQRYGVRPLPVLRNHPACWNRSVSPASAVTTVRARPRPMCTGCAVVALASGGYPDVLAGLSVCFGENWTTVGKVWSGSKV